jgi:hypothetical protein
MIVKVHFAKECKDVEVAEEATVGMLHQVIEEQMDIPVHKQKLISKGKVMADKSHSLSNYNVGPGSKVMLMASGGLTQVLRHYIVNVDAIVSMRSLLQQVRFDVYKCRAKWLQGNTQTSGDGKRTSVIKSALHYPEVLLPKFVPDQLPSLRLIVGLSIRMLPFVPMRAWCSYRFFTCCGRKHIVQDVGISRTADSMAVRLQRWKATGAGCHTTLPWLFFCCIAQTVI